jgi:serine incorporator 1/3
MFFVGATAALVYMFFVFTGCTTNNVFVSLTLIFCIVLTVAQLTGSEGNLLSVSCISAWAVYLCYTAVIKNPDANCNPKTEDSSRISIAYGLILTLISLSWTGWSYTAEDKLTDLKSATPANESEHVGNGTVPDEGPQTKRNVTGVVVTQTASDDTSPDENDTPADETLKENVSSNSWKLNVALVVVSCWCAMTLTQWGVVEANDGTIAHRNVGHISMWVIIGSQWFVMILYLWTLIAPRLFPDRDFS